MITPKNTVKAKRVKQLLETQLNPQSLSQRTRELTYTPSTVEAFEQGSLFWPISPRVLTPLQNFNLAFLVKIF